MATYRYTTKPQRGRGGRIILTPCGSSHTVNNMDLSKNKAEETEHNKLYEINMSQSKNQSWNKGNWVKLDFLLCLIKYSAAGDEPQEAVAITE